VSSDQAVPPDRPEPVVPRPAATVILVRDAPDPAPGRRPLQVFLQRRVAGMAFAGGMTVFPGGGVDPADLPDPAAWSGPDPGWWGERFGLEPERAGALVCAAVRETFEECGVLLAGPGRAGAELLGEGRADLVAHRRTLGQLLGDAGLVLRSELLRPWSRWITPPVSPRRYDTAFLVAVVPEGQDADAHTTEAVEAAWWHPDEALEEGARGGLKLMAPTYRTLQQIAEHPTSAALFAAAERRVISPITPRARKEGGDVVLDIGDDGPPLRMDGERTLIRGGDS
jgi:8-oxo-dGTP pyrophosphatase MutT (NUDIX family)